MDLLQEHARLVDLIKWIDQHTSGISLPGDERSMLAVGCFEMALEHQAAIALLHQSELFGSAFALARVQLEALVRGMWLLHCASPKELQQFQKGRVPTPFSTLVERVEVAIDDTNKVLSGLLSNAWTALNGFTHTGIHQVSRRYSTDKIEGNYSIEDRNKALGLAGALGLVAASQLIGMAERQDLLPAYFQRMTEYAQPSS